MRRESDGPGSQEALAASQRDPSLGPVSLFERRCGVGGADPYNKNDGTIVIAIVGL